MTLDKEYLHLEEAENIPGLTRFKIIQFFRENKINLYLSCDTIKLFATGVFKGNQRASVLGSFNYSGIVMTDRNLINELLRKNQTIKANNFIVLEPNNITEWRNEKPKIAFPNEKYLNYKHTPKPKKPFSAVVRFLSWSRHPMNTQISGLLNSALEPMLTNSPENEKKFKKSISDLTKAFSKKLSYDHKEFYPEDIRFKKSELIKLIQQQTLPKIDSQNPIEQIIYRVVLKKGILKVNQIWNILKEEANHEDHLKEYDLDNLLYKVGMEELEYFKRPDLKETIKYSTFKKYRTNVINQLKREGLISK